MWGGGGHEERSRVMGVRGYINRSINVTPFRMGGVRGCAVKKKKNKKKKIREVTPPDTAFK